LASFLRFWSVAARKISSRAEALPGDDPGCVFCIHTHLLTRHGLVNQEVMYLDELIRDDVYTFAYIYSPAPIVGATGSPGAPIAID